MTPEQQRHTGWLAASALLLMLLTMVIASGCSSSKRTQTPAPLTQAGEGLAGIAAHNESAERAVGLAKPYSTETGKALLDVATAEHGAIKVKAGQASTAVEAARQEAAKASAELAAEQEATAALKSKWYTVWGQRIEFTLKAIAISWLLLGVSSVLLGIGNPLSAAGRFGKEIVRLLPFANPFSWVRDWINSRQERAKEQAIQTAVAKVVARPQVARPIPAVVVVQEPEIPVEVPAGEDDLSARA